MNEALCLCVPATTSFVLLVRGHHGGQPVTSGSADQRVRSRVVSVHRVTGSACTAHPTGPAPVHQLPLLRAKGPPAPLYCTYNSCSLYTPLQLYTCDDICIKREIREASIHTSIRHVSCCSGGGLVYIQLYTGLRCYKISGSTCNSSDTANRLQTNNYTAPVSRQSSVASGELTSTYSAAVLCLGSTVARSMRFRSASECSSSPCRTGL